MILFDIEKVTKAVVIFAHPDDAESSAGGTISKLTKNNVEVTIVNVALGDKGKSTSNVRQDESVNSAHVLNVKNVINLGYLDGEFENNLELREKVTKIIRENKPELVICPDPEPIFFAEAYINHRDHRETGWAVVDVISSAVGNEKYFPETKPHSVPYLLCAGSKDPNCVVDISEDIDKKIESISCYKSQLSSDTDEVFSAIRENSKHIGRLVDVEYGEAYRFCLLSNNTDLI
ncbi:MAG: PIG-L family deacetylase [Acidimicrobiia bacterium]